MALTIHIDGAARGNPGPAAAGLVIQDHTGRKILEAGYFLGFMTNNQAEYHALLLALQAAQTCADPAVTIFCDSELLVRQISGQYRVRDAKLRSLFEQVQQWLPRFDGWQISHIPRRQNCRADELASKALDARNHVVEVQTGQVLPSQPLPTCLRPVEIVIECTAPPHDDACPAPCRAGQVFRFVDVVPPGLCLHAAQATIQSVLAMQARPKRPQPAASPVTVRCSHPGCGAVFALRYQQEAPATDRRR